MICEKIDLYGDHRVMLYTYVPHWTPVQGCYPRRSGVIVLPGGAYVTYGNREGEPVALAFAAAAIMPMCCGIPLHPMPSFPTPLPMYAGR